MTFKTITIKEEVYKLLLSIKGRDESFSNLEILKELRASVIWEQRGALRGDSWEKVGEEVDKNSEKGEDALKHIEKTGEDVAITSLNLHEVLYGLYKYAYKDKVDKILLLDVIDFKKEDARLSSKLEFDLEKKGKRTARTDSMTAAIAINGKHKLYTFNKKHFKGIRGLELV